MLTQEALKEGKVDNELHVVDNGDDAMGFLRREGSYAGSPRPDLVLLDLNLPRKDGREVLGEMRADPDLKTMPVVVLTTSKDEKDVTQAYGLHANCYIAKPVDLDEFIAVIKSIDQFWFTVVTLPPAES